MGKPQRDATPGAPGAGSSSLDAGDSPSPGLNLDAALEDDAATLDAGVAVFTLPDLSSELPGFSTKGAAFRHANLSPAGCRAQLRKRKLPIKRTGGASGVATPLRVVGPMHGVAFLGPGKKSKYSILDCRLALALDDFAEVLQEYDIVEVWYGNSYRPRSRIAGRRVRSQHRYGLAIDIVSMKLKDGRALKVERDWRGAIGQPVCRSSEVTQEPTEETLLLRKLVCDVATRGIFHHMLTPNFDAAHRTHFHFDIKRNAKRGGAR